MSEFVGPEPGALVFCGLQGGPLSRSNFNKMPGGCPRCDRSRIERPGARDVQSAFEIMFARM
jgi:hypothetical protein